MPTHTAAVLTFASGVIGTAQMSFDVWDSDLPVIEIYGTEGTLSLANPNHFDGDVRVRRHGEADWTVLPPVVELFGAVGTKEQARRGRGQDRLRCEKNTAEIQVNRHHVLSCQIGILDYLFT